MDRRGLRRHAIAEAAFVETSLKSLGILRSLLLGEEMMILRAGVGIAIAVSLASLGCSSGAVGPAPSNQSIVNEDTRVSSDSPMVAAGAALRALPTPGASSTATAANSSDDVVASVSGSPPPAQVNYTINLTQNFYLNRVRRTRGALRVSTGGFDLVDAWAKKVKPLVEGKRRARDSEVEPANTRVRVTLA